DPRTGEFYTSNMIIGTSGGAGATHGLDGWPCLGLAGCAGGMLTGNIELLEHEYPIQIHRYELRPDSASPGRWRGGLASVCETEPLGQDASLVLWGEGFKYPAAGVAGGQSKFPERKVFKKFLVEDGGANELPPHGIVPIRAGQRLRTCPPGGGGIGDPHERPLDAVALDVRNGVVSLEAAREEYAVVLDPETYAVDKKATERLRAERQRPEI